MKRYLVCTLLVINAVPAQAGILTGLIGASIVGGGIYYIKEQDKSPEARAQQDWCKDQPGCETFTYAYNTAAHYAAKTLEGNAAKSLEGKQSNNNDSIIARIKATTDMTIKNSELEINKQFGFMIDSQHIGKWGKLIESCQSGAVAQCDELTKYSQNVATSAPKLGMLNKRLADLKERLLDSQALILNINNIDELSAATHQYNTVLKEFEMLNADIKKANMPITRSSEQSETEDQTPETGDQKNESPA